MAQSNMDHLLAFCGNRLGVIAPLNALPPIPTPNEIVTHYMQFLKILKKGLQHHVSCDHRLFLQSPCSIPCNKAWPKQPYPCQWTFSLHLWTSRDMSCNSFRNFSSLVMYLIATSTGSASKLRKEQALILHRHGRLLLCGNLMSGLQP
jgi:hypothetical protein